MDCVTTVEDSYQPPPPTQACTIGKRQEIIKQQLYQKVSSGVHEEFHPPPPKMEYVSTTKNDFGKGIKNCPHSLIPVHVITMI